VIEEEGVEWAEIEEEGVEWAEIEEEEVDKRREKRPMTTRMRMMMREGEGIGIH